MDELLAPDNLRLSIEFPPERRNEVGGNDDVLAD
jgi:hypothetical protein